MLIMFTGNWRIAPAGAVFLAGLQWCRLVSGHSVIMYLGKVELRPLRVAIFSGNYNAVMDGPARALNLLAGYLESQGIESRVYAPTVSTPAFAPQGTLVSIPSVPIPGRREYRLGLGLPKAVRADLEAFRPSLVHVSAPDLSGHAAMAWARGRGIPVVASCHTRFDTYLRYYGLGALRPLATRLLVNFYNRADLVLAPSPCMREELRKSGVRTPVRLWSRGVDHVLFNPGRRDQAWRQAHDVREPEVLIAYVGRMVMEKDLGLLVRALRTLRAHCVPHHCLMVGEGPARASLERKMPGAIFTGHLSGPDLARAYASSDIFFNPSRSETFGNTTLEAMASGVPAVAANAPGSRALVVHGKTGFLAKPGDADDFVHWLTRLAKSPDVRRHFGRQALKRSEAYQWPAVLASVLENYYDVLGQTPYVFANTNTHSMAGRRENGTVLGAAS